jgi:hypothetical protein
MHKTSFYAHICVISFEIIFKIYLLMMESLINISILEIINNKYYFSTDIL